MVRSTRRRTGGVRFWRLLRHRAARAIKRVSLLRVGDATTPAVTVLHPPVVTQTAATSARGCRINPELAGPLGTFSAVGRASSACVARPRSCTTSTRTASRATHLRVSVHPVQPHEATLGLLLAAAFWLVRRRKFMGRCFRSRSRMARGGFFLPRDDPGRQRPRVLDFAVHPLLVPAAAIGQHAASTPSNQSGDATRSQTLA